MFRSLYYIGKMESENLGRTPEELSLILGVRNIEKTIEIQVTTEGGISEISVGIKAIDQSNKEKYGAYGKNPNGVNILYYDIVDGEKARKQYTKKGITNIQNAFRNNILDVKLNHELPDIIKEKQDSIEEELNKKSYDKDSKYLLTVSYNGKYPWEIPECKAQIIDAIRKKNIDKSKGQSYLINGHCTICNQDNKYIVGLLYLDEAYMFFNYGTAIYARGFAVNNAYKDTSICDECAEYINLGSRIVVSNTMTSVPWMKDKEGKNCVFSIVLPRLLSQDSRKGIETYNYVINDYLSKRHERIKASERTLGILEDCIAEQKNVVCFDFVYYSPAQRKINILKQVKEVLPSRLRFLIDTAKDVQAAYQKRIGRDNLGFKPNDVLRNVLSMRDIRPENISTDNKKNTQDWFMDYFEILDALYSGKQVSEARFLSLLNRYMGTFISYYEEYKYPYSIFNEGLNLYQYLIQTKTIDISKETIMDLHDLKTKFERTHGLAYPIQEADSEDKEGKVKENPYKKISGQFFQYWMALSTIYRDHDYCFAFCMGYIANQVRYKRGKKGNFVDDWLSNITTNINKLDYLMTRSIESLSIERCLESSNVKIPLALAAFFQDQGVATDDSTLGYNLIFPFVSGFMFRTSIDDNKQDQTEGIQEPEAAESVEE